MSGLKQQIEKRKAVLLQGNRYDLARADELSQVEGLLADYVCKSKKELLDIRQELEKAREREFNASIKHFIGGKIQMIDEIMPPKSPEKLLEETK